MPRLAVEVRVDFGEEVLQLLRLHRQRVLLCHEREQLGLELRIQPGDHELNGVADLADPLVLGRPHHLHVPLDLLHETDEFHQVPPEKAHFLLEVGHVLQDNSFCEFIFSDSDFKV